MLSVIVLGAGPAGLLAAETAVKFGSRVIVASRGRGRAAKSELHGCQYLHAPVVPNIGDPADVKYSMVGTAEEYRQKVYGELWQGTVSPDEYGQMESHRAWDIRRAYDQMWDFWEHRIFPIDSSWPGGGFDKDSLSAFLNKIDADLVVSTIPAPALCRRKGGDGENPHNFSVQKIWAMGETPTRTVPIPCEDNSVVYNGSKNTGWYRAARVFGRTTVEWPWRDGRKPPFNGVVEVQKPLKTDCDCWLEEGGIPFVRAGRYGKWQKGFLVHHVVDEVVRSMDSITGKVGVE